MNGIPLGLPVITLIAFTLFVFAIIRSKRTLSIPKSLAIGYALPVSVLVGFLMTYLIGSATFDNNMVRETVSERVRIYPIDDSDTYVKAKHVPEHKEGRTLVSEHTSYTILAHNDETGRSPRYHWRTTTPTISNDGNDEPYAIIERTRTEVSPTHRLWWGTTWTDILFAVADNMENITEIHLPADGVITES